MHKVVIVGASLAGLRTAEALRKRGYDGRLWLVGDEPHAPYDRPPLSKQILTGEWDPNRVFFRQKEGYGPLELDLVFGARAQALDVTARTVRLTDGSVLDFDGLVIATGARARWPAVGQGLAGVHVVRSLDDALAIRAALAKKPRVLVIGAGFIGLEVAAACRKLGIDVTIVEAEARPLTRNFGAQVGEALAVMHRGHGVDLRCNTLVTALEGAGRVERARLSDGSSVEVDLVVAGIGVIPEVEWLKGSGIALGNGVECDASCATNVPGIVAAGDVASAPNRLFGETLRIEHWSNAIDQAQLAAAALLGQPFDPNPMAQVPYFWSDQYDIKLQFAGRVRPDDELVVVEGDLTSRAYVALFGREGVLCGALACNRPAPFIRIRKLVAQRAAFEAAIGAAGGARS
jgi:3-phenylpropionate/trans-cinnamate dioxygenase ferredoxin reductase component